MNAAPWPHPHPVQWAAWVRRHSPMPPFVWHCHLCKCTVLRPYPGMPTLAEHIARAHGGKG